MEKITPITAELNELGSSLAKFPLVNPYKAPAGYFDGFPDRMLSIISGLPVTGVKAGLPTPYRVPGSYFESLPDIILQKAKTSAASVQSFEPGEDWMWCYADQVYIEPPQG